MAEAISQEEDSFTCPVCLDLLRDPVAISCGHNYCMRCIKGCWDQEDQKEVYSCPLCKHTFTPRPVLYKNPLIAEMVEKFRRTKIQAAPHNYVGHGDVECDVCTGRKLKAVKSCLECLVSYCETHYKVHNDLNPGRKHSVVDATGQLQERICSRHEKVLEIFCRTDQNCICLMCLMDDHKGHDTVTAAAERTNKQVQLGQSQRRFQQRLQEREKELQELRKAVETLKSSAQTAVEDSERIFTEMIRSIERRRSEVKELIRAQEKAEVSRAEGLLKRMEQEIAELKRRDVELEKLSHTKDHIQFLKNIPSIRDSPHSKDLPSVTFNQSFSFEVVKESVSAVKVQLEEKLDGIFKQEVAKISAAVTHIQIIRSSECTDPELLRRIDSMKHLPLAMSSVQTVFPELVTREKLVQYCCHFTLDPNTAHRILHLSEGNRRVEWRAELQSYPDHPERFDLWCQVLCSEGVSGRCYWEVERSGEWVRIAVSYKSISRKGLGDECVFGGNDQSWSLEPRCSSSYFWHDNKWTKLPLVASSRIGVYVDHRAGTLAFYSISDTITLLHRVQTTFTHTLYPGFVVNTRSSVKLL
ncbi:tripartite motif-containing protein 16-like [Alosa sapidissima]|uniref:tripartite motif-containing protein 16-like n=1 Tax=Alosa sapidissima TaxID=34773 RepID=UPI001C0940E7|nr:tripartite motif-containing protein 16-like [Alosa sapidissima]XP_041948546.1 tripartite motif-containing protein 16-like [Alosa sapidissima]